MKSRGPVGAPAPEAAEMEVAEAPEGKARGRGWRVVLGRADSPAQ